MARFDKPRSDARIPYGARCTWWDSIDKVASRSGLPVCPHCLNVLFEVDSLETWMAGARRYEASGHPGYVDFITWSRGKCFPNMAAAQAAYAAETAPQLEDRLGNEMGEGEP